MNAMKLPEIEKGSLVSSPIVFKAGNRWYTGYYHANGYFYALFPTKEVFEHVEKWSYWRELEESLEKIIMK